MIGNQIVSTAENIKHLEEKGLIVTDMEQFKYYVRNFNINTFIAEYSEFFTNQHGRYDGVTSEELINFYNFDRNLANHLFRNLLVIEKIINTNVANSAINEFQMKDKCLFSIDKTRLAQIFCNVDQIDPPQNVQWFMEKLVKYCQSNTATKPYGDWNTEDRLLRWRKVPLDVLCLSWSFSTTFNFFIACDDLVRDRVLINFGLEPKHLSAFVDFIKNVIHVRNFISHNIPVYNVGVRYVTPELIEMYEFIFKEKPTAFKFYHLIRLFGHFSNDPKLLQKTMSSIDLINLKPEHRAQILSLIK